MGVYCILFGSLGSGMGGYRQYRRSCIYFLRPTAPKMHKACVGPSPTARSPVHPSTGLVMLTCNMNIYRSTHHPLPCPADDVKCGVVAQRNAVRPLMTPLCVQIASCAHSSHNTNSSTQFCIVYRARGLPP